MKGGTGHRAAQAKWTIGLGLVVLAVLVIGRVVDIRHVRSTQPPALATLNLTLPATSHHVNVVFENHAVETLEEVSWPSDHLLAVYHATIHQTNWSAFSQLPMPSQRSGLVGWRLGSAFWTVIPHGRLMTLLVATPTGMSVRVSSLTQGHPLPAPRVLADFAQTLRSYQIPRGASVALRLNRTAIYELKIFLPPPSKSVEPPQVVGAFPGWEQSPPSAGPFMVRNAHLGTAPVVAAILPAGLVVELAHSVGLVTWGDRFVPLLQGSGTFPRRWSIAIGRGPWALIQGPAQSGTGFSQEQSQWWWWNIATGSLTRAPLGNAYGPVLTTGDVFGISSGSQPGVYVNGRRTLTWPTGFRGAPTPNGQLVGWCHGTFGIYSGETGFHPIALAPINGHALTPTLFWTVAWLPVWGPTLIVQPADHQMWPAFHAHLLRLLGSYPAFTVSAPLVPWPPLPFLVHVTNTISIGWPNAGGQLQWHDVGAPANPFGPDFGVSWDGVWWLSSHGLQAWLYPGSS